MPKSGRSITCPACLVAMAPVITCPSCKTPGAEELTVPIPNTDDTADGARCLGLAPCADIDCTECGGSGHTGRGSVYEPRCTRCGEFDQEHNAG